MAWSLLDLIIMVLTVANIYWAFAMMLQVLYIQQLVNLQTSCSESRRAVVSPSENKQGRLRVSQTWLGSRLPH